MSGCAFATIFALYISHVNIPVYSFTTIVVMILQVPFLIGMYIGDILLGPVCHFSTTNICRGLGFDGGPLEWVEWTSLIGGGILIYGLIFWGVYRLYLFIRNKAKKQTSKIQTFLFDFSRVLIFPKDKNYQGSLNELYRQHHEQPGYNIFSEFELNDELLTWLDKNRNKFNLWKT